MQIQIFLGGDSAGGNISLGLLSHLAHSHPHQEIPELKLPHNLRGVCLISPWVTFDHTGAAYHRYRESDFITAKWLDSAAGWFTGDSKTDAYNQPLTASADWWGDIPVNEILVVAGSDEGMVDDIRTFGQKLTVRHFYFRGDEDWLLLLLLLLMMIMVTVCSGECDDGDYATGTAYCCYYFEIAGVYETRPDGNGGEIVVG